MPDFGQNLEETDEIFLFEGWNQAQSHPCLQKH